MNFVFFLLMLWILNYTSPNAETCWEGEGYTLLETWFLATMCLSKATFLHGGMMERFPLLHLFNYKSKHPPTAVFPVSRNSAIDFSGAVNIARNNENLHFCPPDPTLPAPMQLLFIVAMISLIEGAQVKKDSCMALAAALKRDRAFFAISLQ